MKEKKEKISKKLSSKAKKVIVLSCFCLLLLVTGGVNIYLNNLAVQQADANVQAGSFFSNYRTDRQQTRSQELLYLEAIVASTATSAEAKSNAEAEMLRLSSSLTMIMTVEQLIKAKGFSDVVVSASTSTLTVMVETDGLTKAEVAQIVDIVRNNSDYIIDNIKILEV